MASIVVTAAASTGASVGGGCSMTVDGGVVVDVPAAAGSGDVDSAALDVDVSAAVAHAARNLLAGRATSPSPAARRNRLRSTYLPGSATADSGALGSEGPFSSGALRNKR